MSYAPVSIQACADYEEATVRQSMGLVLRQMDALNFVRPGMTVAVKVNLVSAAKPEEAATTHPALVRELCRLITEKGARAVVGDSPGGLYSRAALRGIYQATGLHAVEEVGGSLNDNFEVRDAVDHDAAVLHTFPYTAWLEEADAIICFAKLKTHAMMGMTCSVKNMFGAIPGTDKPEYHYRYPNPTDFSRMLVDINAYFKPVLTICDGIMAMEGNGPSMGKPRKMGLLAASKSPHKLDLVLAALIHMNREDVPTLEAAYERGLIPGTVAELNVTKGWEQFICPDFETIGVKRGLLFTNEAAGIVGKLWSRILKAAVQPRPQVKKEDCIGCGECSKVCPAKAITMIDKKPSIDYTKCIRCFCCQEFCPIGAMKVQRTGLSKLMEKIR